MTSPRDVDARRSVRPARYRVSITDGGRSVLQLTHRTRLDRSDALRRASFTRRVYRRERNRRDTLTVVHPFAADRDQYYRFSGGDTVTMLRVGGTSGPDRAHTCAPGLPSRDPVRRVRRRDRPRRESFRRSCECVDRLSSLGVANPFGDVVRPRDWNRRRGVCGVRQRRSTTADTGCRHFSVPSFRRVFRRWGNRGRSFVSSRRSATSHSTTGVVAPDTSLHPRVVVTWAPTDSVGSFDGWRTPLGTQTSSVRADDFADPRAPRKLAGRRATATSSCSPLFARAVFSDSTESKVCTLASRRRWHCRSAAPGLSCRRLRRLGLHRADGAWRRVRVVEARRRRRSAFARRARTLVDERLWNPAWRRPRLRGPPLFRRRRRLRRQTPRRRLSDACRPEPSTSHLSTVQARLWLKIDQSGRAFRRLGSRATAASDSTAERVPGDYAFGSLDAEFHPSVTGDFARPGLGARLHYEYASGDLDWQRAGSDSRRDSMSARFRSARTPTSAPCSAIIHRRSNCSSWAAIFSARISIQTVRW